jgi:hypothetical protein
MKHHVTKRATQLIDKHEFKMNRRVMKRVTQHIG